MAHGSLDLPPLGDDKAPRETGAGADDQERQDRGTAPLGDYDVDRVEKVYR